MGFVYIDFRIDQARSRYANREVTPNRKFITLIAQA